MLTPVEVIHLIITALILVATFAVAIGLLTFIKRYITRVVGRTRTKIDDYAVTIVKGPVSIFIILFGVIAAIRYLNSTLPGTLPDWLTLNVDALTTVMGILVATSIVSLILNKYVGERIKSIIRENPDRETTFRLLHRLAIYIVYLVGGIAVISVFTKAPWEAFMGVVVGAGFLAIVIGLAAQRVLGNLLSGININVTRPIRLGDAVMIRGEFGFVEDITLRHTVIRVWDNRRMVIPNSVLDDEVIINYSLKDPTMLVPVFVQVSYESDLDKAMKVMVDVARKHPDCLPIGNLPNVVVMEFTDSGISLRLLSRAKDQPTAFQMARDLLYQVKKEFDANGIEIPYPRRHLILGEDKTGITRQQSSALKGQPSKELNEEK